MTTDPREDALAKIVEWCEREAKGDWGSPRRLIALELLRLVEDTPPSQPDPDDETEVIELRVALARTNKLLDDAHWAESQLGKEDNQFTRRTYVRSVFAYIEGAIWLLKQTCLNVPPKTGVRHIDPATYALLQDQTYELKNNGEPKTQTKFLRLPDNLRFAFRTFDTLFQTKIDLGVGSGPWESFLKAVEIRHRITHPKNLTEFDVTDTELEVAQQVSSWFNDLTHHCIKTMAEAANRNAPNA